MRTTVLSLLLSIIAFGAAASDSADRDFQFAQHLMKEGKHAFALLEFERVRFYHQNHPRSADAAYEAAWLYLTYADDMGKGADLLKSIPKEFPDTDAARQSDQLLAFIEQHGGEEGGKPLKAYLNAQAAHRHSQFSEAEKHYRAVHEKYPNAALAKRAMVERGTLLVTELDKPKEGLQVFRQFLRRYPETEYYQEVYFYSAVGVEKMEGPGEKALGAYRRVKDKLPGTVWADKADERIKAIEKTQNLVKRQYDKDDVATYDVVKKGYTSGKEDVYVVVAELDLGLSDRRIMATLEDAFLKHYMDRKDRNHDVRVEGYYNYPVTSAGELTWSPGGNPEYTITKRKGKDVVKDIFLELLKGKDD